MNITPRGYWKTDRILELCREWAATYGVPPRGEDWCGSGGRYPSKSTVERHFGSWTRMIAVAGFEPLTPATACLYWTAERIIASVHVFYDAHGRIPSAREWRLAAPDHPTTRSVQLRFGGWNAMIVAAGLEPNALGSPVRWTEDAIAAAMLDWLLARGKWPTVWDWRTPNGGNHPYYATVKRVFGSWAAAKRYAGWDPLAATRPPPRVAECSGCGGELDNVTAGCGTCGDRMRGRERWANDAGYREREKQARVERRRLAA